MDQVGVIATRLPFASLPTAVNSRVRPTLSVVGFGVTVMLASGPGVTVTVAVPVSPSLLACTVLMNVPLTVPAVKRPASSTEPPPATMDQVGVNCTTLPPASRPTAVNSRVAPTLKEAGFGVTVIVASGPAVTLTVAVPEMLPLVALAVLTNVPGVPPAVKRPEAPIVPPPAAMDQTGVIATGLPATSLPTAVSCCVAPTTSREGLGVTEMLANGPAITVTVA
jgi:hypothetical protein